MKTFSLSSPGQLAEVSLVAGETASFDMPNATGWLNVGVYEKSGTIREAQLPSGELVNAEVEIVGGGYKDVGSSQLTHLTMQGTSFIVKARHDIGSVHVKYDRYTNDPRIAAKIASRQEKA
jgi:hypothetical protein